MKDGSVKFGKIYQQMISHEERLFETKKRSMPISQQKLDALRPALFLNEPKMHQTQQLMTKYQDFDEPLNYRLEGGRGGGVFKTKKNTLAPL